MTGLPSRRSDRSSRLLKAKLAVSKFDAKYSKLSHLLDRDSSDGLETESQSTSLELKSREAKIQPVTSFQGEEDLGCNNFDEPHSEVKRDFLGHPGSFLPVVDFCPPSNTASSIDSVKTDSMMGLLNVHSVSSLAESVIPIEETDHGKSSVVDTVPIALSMFSTPKTPQISKHSPGDNFDQASQSTSTSETRNNSKKAPRSNFRSVHTERTSDEISPTRTAFKSDNAHSSLINGFEQAYQQKSNFHEDLKSQHTEREEVSTRPPSNKCKRRAVSVQTPFSNHDERSSKEMVMRMAIDSPQSIPTLKAVKLPSYLRYISVEDFLYDSKPTRTEKSQEMDKQIAELVSFHLHLTKELLERQHRLYIENCKAVQILERGYKESQVLQHQQQYVKAMSEMG